MRKATAKQDGAGPIALRGHCLRRLVVAAALVGMLAAVGCRTPPARPLAEPVEEELLPQERVLYAQAESQLRSPDAAVREQAAVMLLSLDYAPAHEAVRENMRGAEDSAVRVSMIRAVAFCVDHRFFDAVLDVIRDPDPEVQREAAAALAMFTLPEEVDALTEMVGLPETSSAQRRLLFKALGDGLAVRAVPVMLEGLESEDEASSIAAWEALRKTSRRQFPLDVAQWRKWWEANSHRTREDFLEEQLLALSRELEALSAQLNDLRDQHQELIRLVGSAESETPKVLLEALASRYSAVRQYSSSRLAALDNLDGLKIDDKDYAVLRDALQDPSEQVRQSVVAFIARVEGELRDELVRRALRDESPAVLVTAVGAVQSGTGQEAVARLERLLTTSEHPEVREAAANMLGKVGSESSISALATGLNDAVENVRWFAVEGLRKLGAVQAVLRISELLEKDPSARVREIAAAALGEFRQPGGVPALIAALDDPSERVRQKTEVSLLALATDDHERMAVIATSLEERDLLDPAKQVLTRIIEQFADAEGMENRLITAHEQLAGVLRKQTDFAGAARVYERLDELTGGSPEVRRQLVDCWLQAGDPRRVVGATERWLAAALPSGRGETIESAFGNVELLLGSGHGAEAGAVLDLIAKAVGEEADPKTGSRLEELRRRVSG